MPAVVTDITEGLKFPGCRRLLHTVTQGNEAQLNHVHGLSRQPLLLIIHFQQTSSLQQRNLTTVTVCKTTM